MVAKWHHTIQPILSLIFST